VPEPKLLTRELTDNTVRVRCGIGHYATVATFKATYRYLDMDGEPMAPFTVEEYDPATCVVCGLRIWSRV
jgi:hypothetical protein